MCVCVCVCVRGARARWQSLNVKFSKIVQNVRQLNPPVPGSITGTSALVVKNSYLQTLYGNFKKIFIWQVDILSAIPSSNHQMSNVQIAEGVQQIGRLWETWGLCRPLEMSVLKASHILAYLVTHMYQATTGLTYLHPEFSQSFIYETLLNNKYSYVNTEHTLYYVHTYLSSSN